MPDRGPNRFVLKHADLYLSYFKIVEDAVSTSWSKRQAMAHRFDDLDDAELVADIVHAHVVRLRKKEEDRIA